MDNTQQFLDAFGQVQKVHPVWRFSTLAANVSTLTRGPFPSRVYDVEDEELLRAAQEHSARIVPQFQTVRDAA